MRLHLILLGVAVAASAATGCRGRSRGAAREDVKGVGFELPGAAHVQRGAILTTPPGREEAFLVFVAGQAPAWVDACLSEAGGQAPRFGFGTGEKGALEKLTPEIGGSARERCLAAQAVASVVSALPDRTQVRVQLALK
jgi:hypothetical protein